MEDWSGLDISMLDIEKQKKLYEEAQRAHRLQPEEEAPKLKTLQEEEAVGQERWTIVQETKTSRTGAAIICKYDDSDSEN